METKFTVTSQQISEMKHAIGGKASKEPYRNYFNTRTPKPEWDDLVSQGLATRRDADLQMGGTYYHLTDTGLEFINKVIL